MKSILVTGGSAGIGEATVQKFSSQGYRVFNLDLVEPTRTVLHAEYIPCDVSRPDAIKQAIDQVLQKTSTLDAVVSSAGRLFSGTIEETSEADFDSIINLNLKGSFFLLKYILPILKKQGFGSIVLLGSDQTFIGKPHSAVYGVSKAAIGQLVKSTALDYAAFRIRVNAVCPGTVDTPMYRTAIQQYHDKTGIPLTQIEQEEANLQPLQRIGTAQEVAELIYFLSNDSAGFITGSLFPIDGGYTAR